MHIASGYRPDKQCAIVTSAKGKSNKYVSALRILAYRNKSLFFLRMVKVRRYPRFVVEYKFDFGTANSVLLALAFV